MTSPATTALFAQTDMTPVGDSVTTEQRDAILHEVAAVLTAEADDQIVGICQVCFRAIVLTEGHVMVRHGWNEIGRQAGQHGLGRQYGGCPGIGFVPFQFSRVATKAYLVKLEAEVVAQRGLVAMWEAGPTPIRIPSYRRGGEDTIVNKGEPRYDSALSNKISSAKSALNSMIYQVGEVKKAIAAWAPAQLTTSKAIEKAAREEVEARRAAAQAERDAKAAAKAARNAPRAAKLAARLAPVLAAMNAEPERWWTDEEITELSKAGGVGPLTDTQLSDFTRWGRNTPVETEYRDNADGIGRSPWSRLKR